MTNYFSPSLVISWSKKRRTLKVCTKSCIKPPNSCYRASELHFSKRQVIYTKRIISSNIYLYINEILFVLLGSLLPLLPTAISSLGMAKFSDTPKQPLVTKTCPKTYLCIFLSILIVMDFGTLRLYLYNTNI